jgi:hypothetical protein
MQANGFPRALVPASGVTLGDIADLWQGAPAMEGEAGNGSPAANRRLSAPPELQWAPSRSGLR